MCAVLFLSFVAGATSIPVFLGWATKSIGLAWFLQVAGLVMVAWTMGVLPGICSNVYPAGVRISGFNFAYNTGIMIFGGLVRAQNINGLDGREHFQQPQEQQPRLAVSRYS